MTENKFFTKRDWIVLCSLLGLAVFIYGFIIINSINHKPKPEPMQSKILVIEEQKIISVHHFTKPLKWPDCVINEQFCKSFAAMKQTEILESETAYYIKIKKELICLE